MFEGKAEEAMNFYTTIFEDSAILSIIRYGENQAGEKGTVMHATFSLKGQEFICIDSTVKHAFSFTPAMSLVVNFEKDEEIDIVFENLSVDGKVMMPLATYPFSQKFGWIADKYDGSWQLNLKNK